MLDKRIEELKDLVQRLVQAPSFSFDESLRSNLPEKPGLYVIFVGDLTSGEVLRAGRATGAGGLRQRVYQNHLMGNQPGNLRAQLVKDSRCQNLEEAKTWIRGHCVVNFVIVEDEELRRWAEHFLLAVIRPKYSD